MTEVKKAFLYCIKREYHKLGYPLTIKKNLLLIASRGREVPSELVQLGNRSIALAW